MNDQLTLSRPVLHSVAAPRGQGTRGTVRVVESSPVVPVIVL